jgi:hypothetical protein
MSKVVLAGLALILLRNCDIGSPRLQKPIEGTWGGENAGLIAFDTTAHVHIGCTAGDTKQGIAWPHLQQVETLGVGLAMPPELRKHPRALAAHVGGRWIEAQRLVVEANRCGVVLGALLIVRAIRRDARGELRRRGGVFELGGSLLGERLHLAMAAAPARFERRHARLAHRQALRRDRQRFPVMALAELVVAEIA